MSSPAKKPNIADAVNKLAELKAADNKLLILGALCISGKVSFCARNSWVIADLEITDGL